MKKILRFHVPVYLACTAIILLCVSAINKTAVVINSMEIQSRRSCIVIDAGHGGVDGGATSCTGVLESGMNLQIAKRLDALFHLLGYNTVMIRSEDISVYTVGCTIAEKKISDLKERLRIIKTTPNALLISIHQNYFYDSQYRGAQVFYSGTEGSEKFAQYLQNAFKTLDTSNHRQHKQAKGVYLMQKIDCTGVLVECGFISNPEEEKLLRDPAYQKKICSIIASSTALYLDQNAAS